ncbi:GNAT family N-acetyltransferase [Vibrio ziniensis]|uniref:GNAT family N-acetyltransferase n=1 Tax=Vibrio ziniensis TaxID=2711221 RepID=A0A6G7CMR9_9VIBR|nr:GNAT family N-acetyltransferase [Vibrio ziniensis]QIH43431.1 GNAT family N-acetyltransferase [Vibrio ziniensis]
MEYSLRKAVESDVEFLVELRETTMGKYLREVGMPTGREAYLERVYYAFDQAEIIVINNSSAGLFKAQFNQDINEWYLVQVQLHPDFQNKGIANRLISQLMSKAKTTGSTVGLSVVKTNPAQRLYERLGFVRVGETDFEYLMQYTPS